MPTRIVLSDKGAAAPAMTPRLGKRRGLGILGEPSQELRVDTTNNDASVDDDGVQSPLSVDASPEGQIGAANNTASRRSIRGFRSSILRELEVRSYDTEDQDEEPVRVSSEDIRASPRLLSYMFCMIAAAVMLVSVVQFYRLEVVEITPVDNSTEAQEYSEKYFTTTPGGLIYQWKLWASMYMSAAGVGLCLLTVVAHFDTICFPRLWFKFFRDGSLAERNWIFFLILFWAAAVHASTSSLSVGEYQANVFFTAWIAFAAIALNYGVWRESAGYRSLSAIVMSQHRATTHNWLWTGLFSTIFAAAATDLYYNRDEIELRLRGQALYLTNRDWITILCVVWAEVLVCILAVVFNEYLYRYTTCRCLPFWNREQPWDCGWRHLEGLVILMEIGGKFYVILEFTGVDGVINGLSNAYYGIWLSFFNSVFCLGTWIRENKSIGYFGREEASHDSEDE